jgi:hypothetical protein
MKNASSQTLVMAKAYLHDIEFASQLCTEIVASEGSNSSLSGPVSDALKMLELIVNDNRLLQSQHHVHVDRQPAWPQHEVLLRFDLQLYRLTKHFKVTQKWIPRFFSMRGCRLYYSDGKNGFPNTRDGTLSFAQTNPSPDGRYCIELQGMDETLHFKCSISVTLWCRLHSCALQRTCRWAVVCFCDKFC